MREQVIYYDDPLRDDFADNHISTQAVGADFDYLPEGILYNTFGALLYYLIAIPVVWLLAKICLGLRMKNQGALRAVRGGAFYLYGNHTQNLDAVIPALAAFPQRAYVIAHRDAVSIPGIRTIVQMLGAIPVPSSLSGMEPFAEALEQRAQEGACIGIYPEAHVWPYYTGVRPFKAASFRYPARSGRPVVAMAATYRPRKLLFRQLRPAMTVTFSEPMYPDPNLPPRHAQEELRRRVYDFLVQETSRPGNVAYIRYLPREDEKI